MRALRDVEEDLQHWTQRYYVMKFFNKGHMNSLINSHQERFAELSHSLLEDLFDSLQKLKVLEVQIRNLKLGQDYEIVLAAETDAETEDSLGPTLEDYLSEQIASSEIWNILNKCRNTKPEGRINIEEVVVSLEAEMKANGWDPSASIRVPKLDGEDPMAS
ncbi:hypothetical protein FRC05_002386 [Tulasnella sp. 425]|nr:hypothetical protein FRC05_002386 [Tulasnella sp. 425]